jgi:peptidyl-prolyl cis-trans isomerase C
MPLLYRKGENVVHCGFRTQGGTFTVKKSIFLYTLVIFFCIPALAFAGGKQEEEGEPAATESEEASDAPQGDRIAIEDAVARVNGQLVGRDEFDEVVESNISRYETQSGQEFDQAQRPLLERQVLDGLITRTVLEQETDRLDIVVEEERFQQTLGQFLSQFPNESAYQMALEQQGFTEEQFETELRRQMVIEELIRTQVYDQVEVAEEAMRGFYDANPQYFQQPEQVAARHIIFTTEDNPSEDERTALQEDLAGIRAEIVGGADFAEMARTHSQGPSGPNGGSLGVFGRGQMVPEFEEQAFTLAVGEVSDVFETQFGYHIMQVTERIPATTLSFEESREQIREFLIEEERNESAQRYVEELRAAATVEELISLD